MDRNSSFFSATARQRAAALVDPGTFRELLGPEARMTSPHLPQLGEAVAFDDGVVTGVGKVGARPVFVISQEGRFIGGSVGEVGGGKIVGIFELARALCDKIDARHPGHEAGRPAVVWSFETGGVRLHEANAGLLAHAEIMEQIQACRGRIPMISVIGSKVGCFGGMGFVAIAADAVIMSDLGRLGLTGPEVIEEVMGKQAFDASDRGLIYRTTGGKHKYIMGDCSYLVADTLAAFAAQVSAVLAMPYAEIAAHRSIGTKALAQEQLALVALAARLRPPDAQDMWAHYGNREPQAIPDMSVSQFLKKVQRRPRRG